ncbi:MAG: DUF1800 family protein [Verrucomicrobia bacterium]|nr:DUF1800 family protein [Verrucomicrobiota bacterium]
MTTDLTRFGSALCVRLSCALLLSAIALCGQSAGARLANISTRGQVGADADNIFGGFVIAGGPKTVLVRAIGPGLAAFGVPGTLTDPTLTIFDSKNAAVASNDNWNAADATQFSGVGAFPLPTGSKDAVVVTTLQPGAYTAQISGVGTANTGVALLEVYDVGGAGQLVNIATRLSVGTGANAAVAGFVVAPGAGTRKLLVRGVGPALAAFGLGGTLPDPKLTVLDAVGSEVAVVNANGGASALTAAAGPAGAFVTTAIDTAVIVNVAPGSYTAQLAGLSGTTSGVALIEVYDITASTGTPPAFGQSTRLFFTNLRSSAAGSTASGYATVLFDPNTASAFVSVSFSNLSSTQSGAHLVLGAAGGNGTFVLDLPRGQVSGAYWSISAKGPYSVNDIVAALLTGNLSVQIDTANFPAGEIRSALAPTRGSITFTAPAAPPALPAGALTSPTPTDAARFLTQATFGPTTATIAALQARGIPGWIDDQMALPMTSAVATLRATKAAIPTPFNPAPGTVQRAVTPVDWAADWWKISVTAPDQLRQRVAFALSELLVVGADGSDQSYYADMKANYYDILLRGAFGSYRQLLEDVSVCPTMGLWLTYMGNQPADPVKGTSPDENYAREVQQLFTIGLVQLQPDGTLMLDASAQPIPTYDQTAISETARVFTGWGYAVNPITFSDATTFKQKRPTAPGLNVIDDASAWFQPMVNYSAFHDSGTKRVVSLDQVPLAQARPTAIPAGQTGLQDLRSFLDTLFAHPNVGPFVSRHLIQRLVTANPSPGYVYRAAQVFANDGTGARGNLGAVVRAILADYEARSPAVIGNLGYGKLKEPLIRMTTLFRAANFSAPNGEWLDSYYNNPTGYGPNSAICYPGNFAQWPVNADTVFNFFSPTYAQPGAMAAAGLVSPEMQIVDSSYSIWLPRTFQSYLFRNLSTFALPASGASPYVDGDYAAFLPDADNATALINQLNLVFCAGQMSAATQSALTTMHQNLMARSGVSALNRVKGLINVVMISPDGATQR